MTVCFLERVALNLGVDAILRGQQADRGAEDSPPGGMEIERARSTPSTSTLEIAIGQFTLWHDVVAR